MRLRWGLYLAFLTAPVLGASTLDVSTQTSAVMHTGDTLVFQLSTWNFAANTAAFGLPAYPAAVNFALVSAPLGGAGTFAATLESADGSVSVAFGDLAFATGYFQGTGYTGEVSTLQGYLPLSPVLSGELFNGSAAFILLRNEGPDVTLGLAPYVLRQDLYASLVGWSAVRWCIAWPGGPGNPGKSGPFDEFGRNGGPGGRFPGAGTAVREASFRGRRTVVRALAAIGAPFQG